MELKVKEYEKILHYFRGCICTALQLLPSKNGLDEF